MEHTASSSSAPKADSQSQSSQSLSLAEWEHRTFCEILQVNLTSPQQLPSSSSSSSSGGVAAASSGGSSTGTHLRELEADLRDSKQPLLLTSDCLDTAIIERLNLPFTAKAPTSNNKTNNTSSGKESGSHSGSSSAFGYLVAAYRSVKEHIAKVNAERLAKQRGGSSRPEGSETSLVLLKKSIISYSGLVLAPTDMVDEKQHALCVKQAFALLAKSSGSPDGLPSGFLAEVVKEIDPDSLPEAFAPIINAVSANPRSISLSNCMRPLMVLQNLTAVPALGAVLAKHPKFNPKSAKNGMELQMTMLLGPYLALTTNGKDPRFANAHQRSQAVSDTRMRIATLQTTVANTLFNMLKAGPQVQEIVLDWISNILRLNQERRKMQFDPVKVSSLGFFVNMGAVMVTLSMPFITSKKDRVRAVNAKFLFGHKGDRISYEMCTRLHTTQSELESLRKKVMSAVAKPKKSKENKTKPNANTTITTTAATTAATTSTSTTGTETKTKSSTGTGSQEGKSGTVPKTTAAATEEKKDSKKSGSGKKMNMVTEMFFLTMETLQLGYVRSLQAFSRIVREIAQCQETIEFMGGENSANPMVFGVKLQLNSLRSSMVAMRTHLLDPKLLRKIFSLYGWAARWMMYLYEGGEEQKEILRAVPEYFAADMANLYILMNRFEPIMVRSQPMQDVMRIVVTLMDSKAMKNAHLRGQLPDVLTLALPVGSIASPDHMLITTPFFTQGLIPRLLGLYVEIEFGENQFYGKFHTRFTITQILKFLWQHAVYHESLRNYDRTKMIRFVNMLCNDAVWLLDEALKQLEEVRGEQKAMASPEFARQPVFARHRREAQFMQLQRTTRSQMNLAYASIHMIGTMSQAYQEPFLSSDLVSRIAEMINYYINKLNGPRVSSLKVKEPKKFGFRPKVLLRELVRIFLVFAESEVFLKAVVGDERSYDAAIFNKAASNLEKRDIVSEREQRRFRAVLAKLESLAVEMKNEEDVLGEVPSKYLDPIMATIMTDPVMLPQSKVVIDRSVIKRHLLNSTTDPFNRSELHLKDLVEVPELKQEIQNFVANKRTMAMRKAAEERFEQARKKTLAEKEKTSVSMSNNNHNSDKQSQPPAPADEKKR